MGVLIDLNLAKFKCRHNDQEVILKSLNQNFVKLFISLLVTTHNFVSIHFFFKLQSLFVELLHCTVI